MYTVLPIPFVYVLFIIMIICIDMDRMWDALRFDGYKQNQNEVNIFHDITLYVTNATNLQQLRVS